MYIVYVPCWSFMAPIWPHRYIFLCQGNDILSSGFLQLHFFFQKWWDTVRARSCFFNDSVDLLWICNLGINMQMLASKICLHEFSAPAYAASTCRKNIYTWLGNPFALPNSSWRSQMNRAGRWAPWKCKSPRPRNWKLIPRTPIRSLSVWRALENVLGKSWASARKMHPKLSLTQRMWPQTRLCISTCTATSMCARLSSRTAGTTSMWTGPEGFLSPTCITITTSSSSTFMCTATLERSCSNFRLPVRMSLPRTLAAALLSLAALPVIRSEHVYRDVMRLNHQCWLNLGRWHGPFLPTHWD